MILTAIAFAAALAGQDPDLPAACRPEDEVETPECSAALQAQLLEMFRAAPIEAEAATGAQLYRAFYGDGYGRDILMISFEMRRDAPPTVIVRGAGEGEMAHDVRAEVWDRIINEGRNADRELAPVAPLASDVVFICMHAWSAQVEMANAENANGESPPVRTRSESGCQSKSLAFRFAFLMAELAVETLPACDQLDPEQHRNDVARLRACLTLSGNTVAAASLMNQKGDPPMAFSGRPVTGADWAAWLNSDTDGALDWNGDVRTGRVRNGDVARIELSDIVLERTAPLSGFRIWQKTIGAHTADEGWIEGELSWTEASDGQASRLMVADYRQEWVRTGDAWRLSRWVAGPARPLENAD